MKDKTNLILEHLQKYILDALVFFTELTTEDEYYMLLEEYLPYALNSIAESQNNIHKQFIEQLSKYDWETNVSEIDRERSYCCHDVGRVGRYTRVDALEGAQMIRSTWDIDNDCEGNLTDYTVFIYCCYGTEGQIEDILYSYILELELNGDSCYEDPTLADDEYSITGISIRLFDVTLNELSVSPIKKVFKYKDID